MHAVGYYETSVREEDTPTSASVECGRTRARQVAPVRFADVRARTLLSAAIVEDEAGIANTTMMYYTALGMGWHWKQKQWRILG